MSVYTPLSLSEVQAFAAPYGLAVTELVPIQGGIENTNYFLHCENGREYVLTVFEELDATAAGELIPVLQHLAAHHVSVAVPLLHSGQGIHTLANKPAQIAPRLAGKHPMPSTLAQAAAIGTAQAHMHVALQQYPLQRQTTHDQAWWQQIVPKLRQQMNVQDQMILDQVQGIFKAMTSVYLDRPTGLIHADLFRDNTLFVDDQLSGILDFSELQQGEFLLDLAITLNDFCTEYPDADLNVEKAQAYLAAYQAVRALTHDEQQCLPIYLAMAACRFWLSRIEVSIRNTEEGRTGADILQKNPLEMRNMLLKRLEECQ